MFICFIFVQFARVYLTILSVLLVFDVDVAVQGMKIIYECI